MFTLCVVAFVKPQDNNGIIIEADESNGSSMTPISNSNRPSHARKARKQENGLR
jgi:hypothetical protein